MVDTENDFDYNLFQFLTIGFQFIPILKQLVYDNQIEIYKQ